LELDAPENGLLLSIITSHALTNFAIFTNFGYLLTKSMPDALAASISNEKELMEHLNTILDKIKKLSQVLLSLPYVIETFTT